MYVTKNNVKSCFVYKIMIELHCSNCGNIIYNRDVVKIVTKIDI